jgi:hypothetical protein
MAGLAANSGNAKADKMHKERERSSGSGFLVIERDFLRGVNPTQTVDLPYPIADPGY